MTSRYMGAVAELLAGTWRDKAGKTYGIPIENIAIEETTDGREVDLVDPLHAGKSLVVVSDRFTHEAIGSRVYQALRKRGNVTEFVWDKPRLTPEGIAELTAATSDAEAFVAVGSGTINDSVKYASFKTDREYSVFPTSPMGAYTTPTASITENGFKKSLTCHSAKGVFFDLGVLARCPKRLIAASFADVVCRTTAQVDWLMSHILFDTPYSDAAYTLLALDEDDLIAQADGIVSGDFEALATLTRISAVMGLGTSFTGTTHVGSMAEHMISHYIDMFAGKDHPGTSHGEQVGVATLSVSRLQNQILGRDEPPVLHATVIDEADLRARFGDAMADTMIEQTKRKALDARTADALNARLSREWDEIAGRLRAVMRPYEELRASMQTAGCQLTGEELGLKPEFYQDAIRYSRFIRDRFTMLDMAGDSGQLEAFARTCH